jgi:hypothetical protein
LGLYFLYFFVFFARVPGLPPPKSSFHQLVKGLNGGEVRVEFDLLPGARFGLEEGVADA